MCGLASHRTAPLEVCQAPPDPAQKHFGTVSHGSRSLVTSSARPAASSCSSPQNGKKWRPQKRRGGPQSEHRLSPLQVKLRACVCVRVHTCAGLYVHTAQHNREMNARGRRTMQGPRASVPRSTSLEARTSTKTNCTYRKCHF